MTIARLYAHEDKLLGRWVYAFYNAATKLERTAMALEHLSNECEADISLLSADTVSEESRILKCLEKRDHGERPQ